MYKLTKSEKLEYYAIARNLDHWRDKAIKELEALVPIGCLVATKDNKLGSVVCYTNRNLIPKPVILTTDNKRLVVTIEEITCVEI